jgi:hypothetical protein
MNRYSEKALLRPEFTPCVPFPDVRQNILLVTAGRFNSHRLEVLGYDLTEAGILSPGRLPRRTSDANCVLP